MTASTASAPEVDGKGCENPTANSPGLQEPASPASGSTSEPALPPLTPQEYRVYNRLAETMDYFVGGPLQASRPSLSREATPTS